MAVKSDEITQENRVVLYIKKPKSSGHGFRKVKLCSLSNISLISGIEGSGKSFLGASIMTAFLDGSFGGFIHSNLPSDRPDIVLFDTEQSRHDVKKVRNRVEAMSNSPENNPRLHVYYMRECTQTERVELFLEAIEIHYKTSCVFIVDGLIDLAQDPNDQKEAASLSNLAMQVTAKYNISVIGMLHLNPNGEKTVGHLGSYFNRKCETQMIVRHNSETKDKDVSFGKIRGEKPDEFAYQIYHNEDIGIAVAELVDSGFISAPGKEQKQEYQQIETPQQPETPAKLIPMQTAIDTSVFVDGVDIGEYAGEPDFY